eukprot:1493473-Amphidinium_carterae.1
MCHGDRTVRHNQVRDVADAAAAAQMHPEREKAGLLPPAPQEEGLGHRNGQMFICQEMIREQLSSISTL